MLIVAIVIGVAVLAAVWIAGGYNSLVRKRNLVDNAEASINVLLKRRYDLVPNLVAVVSQYSKHEYESLTELARMRSQAPAYDMMSAGQRVAFDNAFEKAGVSLRAVAENYPDLKASDNFMHLQRTLNEIEEQLAASRRTFNAWVTDYNNSLQTFPSNLIASMFGFTGRELLSVQQSDTVNPDVKSLFRS